jgi:hypothetical protein
MLSQTTATNKLVTCAVPYLEQSSDLTALRTSAQEVYRTCNTLLTIDVTRRLPFTRRNAIRCTFAVSAAPKVAVPMHEGADPCEY